MVDKKDLQTTPSSLKKKNLNRKKKKWKSSKDLIIIIKFTLHTNNF